MSQKKISKLVSRIEKNEIIDNDGVVIETSDLYNERRTDGTHKDVKYEKFRIYNVDYMKLNILDMPAQDVKNILKLITYI